MLFTTCVHMYVFVNSFNYSFILGPILSRTKVRLLLIQKLCKQHHKHKTQLACS